MERDGQTPSAPEILENRFSSPEKLLFIFASVSSEQIIHEAENEELNAKSPTARLLTYKFVVVHNLLCLMMGNSRFALSRNPNIVIGLLYKQNCYMILRRVILRLRALVGGCVGYINTSKKVTQLVLIHL